jgi:ComF family protein
MRERLLHLRQNTMQIPRGWTALALNICFPPRCSACGVITDSAQGFCSDCFTNIRFIDAPVCQCCGFPFEFDPGDDALCGTCMQDAPPYDKARAAFYYDDLTRSLITRYKYQDRTERTPLFGAMLARSGHELIAHSEVIIPVPLHRRRLLTRKYNQSLLLAHAVADQCGLAVWPDGLLRVRHTTPQAGLTRAERQANVKGAFRVNHRYATSLRGRAVLLVDDVITTGATIHACTKILKSAGAAKIYVLTLAKTVRD